MNLVEVPIGTRITTRYVDWDGSPNEAVGTITARDAETLTLDARRGVVEIPIARIRAWRVVPAAPPRRRAEPPGLPDVGD